MAMHRAKYLAARLVRQHSAHKVLFTTYSRNLATDIKANLQLICTQEELGRIDVLNLDRYVAGCLRKRGFDYQLTYDDVAIGEVWKAVIAESGQSQWSGEEAFLRDEWEEVIKNKGITTLGEYFRSSRRGRGSRMSRAHKASLWKVAEAYHRYMSDHKQWDVYQAMGMVEDSLRAGRITSPYAHIIVDEGQDFSAPAYRMLRAMVPEGTNDLLIVGDAQQRIYGKTVTLSQCGIAIQGRSRRLRINYRTTEQIRDAAERVFDTNGTDVSDEAFKAVLGESMQGDPERFDDLNGETVESNDSHSLMQGPAPVAKRFHSQHEEHKAVDDWITEQIAKNGEDYERSICIVAPAKYLCDQWVNYFEQHGRETYVLGREAEDTDRPGIRVATMHRVKGLEFDTIVVADINPDTVPPEGKLEETTDVVSRRELCKQYRSLIYVALTRARKEALMVGVK
ncbi:MAG: AAA family ATPase [Bifidobacterium castoris]|nr:AAA family ATPase [Bifidobacterium castoris]